MRRIHLKRAIIRPQVHRRRNTRHPPLIHHLRRLSPTNRKLEISVLFPVAKEQRELGQEAVVDVAHEFNGRRAGVARHAALELRRARNEALPFLKVVFVLGL